ncbi:MAG: hypothetical protein ABGY95_01550 [Rubritalea sp.]|uniref:hypothetical protein n=1 Tax=Rubritalea sp. TaxID=2109375 RepID=UPI00324286BF
MYYCHLLGLASPGRPEAHSVIFPNKLYEALDSALQIIESSGLIRPRIYLTLAFSTLPGTYAPSIEEHRSRLTKSLYEHTTQSLSSRSLESLLRISRSRNRVLY